MICAVSLNPAVDKYLRLGRLRLGEHQQVEEAISSAGGKGINVAGVLRALGENVLALGFFGGATGDFILRETRREGIAVDPVHIASLTRTAFVVVEADGRETEIVEPGGAVTPAEIAALRAKVRDAARAAAVMVLSGSVPPGCPDDIYALLLRDCGGRCPVIVDTSRAWLRAVVEAPGPKPSAIKPNRREAESLRGAPLAHPADIALCLSQWHQKGIDLPILSDGARGLYAWQDNRLWRAFSPPLQSVNSVGSGDATVAGLAAAWARGYNLPKMLRLAAACGSANVLTKECAHVRPADLEILEPEIQVAELDPASVLRPPQAEHLP